MTLNAASTKPERLSVLAEAGIERAVFFLPTASRDDIERRLEAIDGAVATVRGA